MDNTLTVITGDCRTVLRELPEQSVQCCVTSPPYWGLRDYGYAEQIGREEQMACGSNKRDVWTVAPANYPDAHFATYPPKLITPCILAGSKPGDVVLDPFAGSGTTGMVALELGRRAVLVEQNPDYVKIIHTRCNMTPGLTLT